MKQSLRFTLNKQDLINAGVNALWFTAPVILIYISSVIGAIDRPNHILSLKDFIPNNITNISIVLWFLNRGIDLLRRFTAGKTK